jgi:tripartite-type tricarboxylate transporter receptor subunit TctC
MKLTATIVAAAVFCGLPAGPAGAQNYPAKPVRVLAPEPGGGNELAGRTIATELSQMLGHTFVVENRGAASGAVAGEILAKAPPDGYTLLYYGSTVWLVPFLRDRVPFDPLTDFAPVSLATRAPFFLFTHPSLPVNSVKELIALAKRKPGALNYGSAGSGAATHLAAELFKTMANVDIVRVAYKGSGPAAIGLLSGEVQLMFVSAPVGMPSVKRGRLKVLAVADDKPSALAPEVPTMQAAGLPGYEASSMSGMFAPAKTPPAIIDFLHRNIVKVLETPEVKDKFLKSGWETVGAGPAEFAKIIRADMAKWSKVIKAAGIHESKGR